MGRQAESSLDQQIALVSEHVGSMPWKSAKANDAAVNCVGCTMLHACYCKAEDSPMSVRALPLDAGFNVANLPHT